MPNNKPNAVMELINTLLQKGQMAGNDYLKAVSTSPAGSGLINNWNQGIQGIQNLVDSTQPPLSSKIVAPIPDTEVGMPLGPSDYQVQANALMEKQAQQRVALGYTGKMDKTLDYPSWMANAPSSPPPPTVPDVQKPNIFQSVGQAIGNVGQTVDQAATMAWNDFIKMATQKAIEAGIPPAVTVGIGALESARGTSSMAKTKKNYFGYQAYDKNPDASKGYSTPGASVDDFITWCKAHPQVMAKANDPVAFTQAIKAAGYASDPDYVQKVINTPEFQHLQHFKPSPTPSPMPKPTLPPKQHTLSDQIISPLAN